MLSCIVAIDKNYAIGKDNNLPWHLSDDLKLFKKYTSGYTIIMGRKTYESIGQPLPNRENIILTHNTSLIIEGCTVINDLKEIKKLHKSKTECFIIGGSTIYQSTLSLCHKLYLTEVNTIVKNADDFFPKIDFSKWRKISSKNYQKNKQNQFDFCSTLWERK